MSKKTQPSALSFFDKASAGWSDRYRQDPSFARRIDRILAAAGPLPSPPSAVLDYGCGAGDICAVLIERGCKVVGVDVSSRMLERAATRTGLSLGEDLLRAFVDSPTLPLPSSHFALCIASSVLEYVPDPRATARELARVLGPNGRLVATVPDPSHPQRRREAPISAMLRMPFAAAIFARTRWSEGVDYLRISKNRLALAEWTSLFTAAGLNATHINPDRHPLALIVADKT